MGGEGLETTCLPKYVSLNPPMRMPEHRELACMTCKHEIIHSITVTMDQRIDLVSILSLVSLRLRPVVKYKRIMHYLELVASVHHHYLVR